MPTKWLTASIGAHMLSIPQQAQPDELCSFCNMAPMIRNEATHDALYHCGTTSQMIREGWHNDGRTAEEKLRTIAYWKQYLHETGRTPRRDDPMLAGFKAPASEARVKPRARSRARKEAR